MAEWGWDDHDDLRIGDVVSPDDVEKLLSYVRCLAGTDCLFYPLDRLEFARSLSKYHAVNIATAMLEGKLGERIDVNEYNLLHHAARMKDPELVQLFLSHGARTDIKLTEGLVGEWDKGLLPLAIALDATRNSEALRNWTLDPRDQSILNLIVTLCDPKMGDALASTKLIAGSSKNVGEEAYYCAMEGKLIDLAVLLIVAREKVLVPLTFPSEDGAGSTRRMTIRQCIEDLISGLSFEEIKLRREFKPEELTQVRRNIMVMRAIGLLLDVFEKLSSSCAYQARKKPQLSRKRFHSGDLNSHDTVGTPIEHLETPSDKSSQIFSPPLPLLQRTYVPFSHGKEIPRDGDQLLVSTHPLLKAGVLSLMEKSNNADEIAKSISGSQYYAKVDVQVKNNQTKVLVQNAAKSLSREKLAYIARFIKR